MKIINLKTNHIFDLPKEESETLLQDFPETFARISKNKKILKKVQQKNVCSDSVLIKILDE